MKHQAVAEPRLSSRSIQLDGNHALSPGVWRASPNGRTVHVSCSDKYTTGPGAVNRVPGIYAASQHAALTTMTGVFPEHFASSKAEGYYQPPSRRCQWNQRHLPALALNGCAQFCPEMAMQNLVNRGVERQLWNRATSSKAFLQRGWSIPADAVPILILAWQGQQMASGHAAYNTHYVINATRRSGVAGGA